MLCGRVIQGRTWYEGVTKAKSCGSPALGQPKVRIGRKKCFIPAASARRDKENRMKHSDSLTVLQLWMDQLVMRSPTDEESITKLWSLGRPQTLGRDLMGAGTRLRCFYG